MREDEALIVFLNYFRAATELPVVLEAQEVEVTVPGVLFDEVRSSYLPEYHGVKSFAGEAVDEFGWATGSEHHFYHRVTADLVVRSEDLGEAYDTQAALFTSLVPFMDDPRGLHEDLCQLEAGSPTPRRVPFREPDWHEVGRPISFVYILREIVDGDTLEGVETVVDPDFTLEFSL